MGDSAVGKTSIANRLTKCCLTDTHAPTMGIDFDIMYSQTRYRKFPIDGKTVLLQIWDVGSMRYSYPLTKMLYKRVNYIVAVYDVTNQQSFDNLERYWLDEWR